MNTQGRLLSRFTQHLPSGKVCWIGVRPARKEAMLVVDRAMAIEGVGLEGDRRCQGKPGSARQVTIISQEYIAQISHFLRCVDPQRAAAIPELLRRNIVISGMNLTAIRHQRIRIGDAVLETNALCHPCSRMEKALGEGGVAAMLGHGGLCAKVIEGGEIWLDADVVKLD